MATILITGSNSGFGRLAALALARGGHDVIATMRTPSKGEDLQRLADDEGLSIAIGHLDVTDPTSVEACLADPHEIDVLVNNAGFEVEGAIEQIDDSLMWRQLDTNVMGPLRTMRAVLPAWRERGSGVIVNVSSIAGRVGSPYAGAYSASKYALEAMSESLNFEVGQSGIRVHLIEPGRFTTSFQGNKVRPESWADSDQERCLSKTANTCTQKLRTRPCGVFAVLAIPSDSRDLVWVFREVSPVKWGRLHSRVRPQKCRQRRPPGFP